MSDWDWPIKTIIFSVISGAGITETALYISLSPFSFWCVCLCAWACWWSLHVCICVYSELPSLILSCSVCIWIYPQLHSYLYFLISDWVSPVRKIISPVIASGITKTVPSLSLSTYIMCMQMRHYLVSVIWIGFMHSVICTTVQVLERSWMGGR